MAVMALPWEAAHDGRRPLLFSQGALLTCRREYKSTHTLAFLPQRRERIRVLTLTPYAGMDEPGRAFAENARYRMRTAVSDAPIDIEALPQTTMEALRLRLEQEPPIDVLDYYGHGVKQGDESVLVFDTASGGRDLVSANRLASLPRLPSLIVLHACNTGHIGSYDPFTSIALTLSTAGVYAVIAMQLATRMTAATAYMVPTLYQALSQGLTIQEAVAQVRQVLYAEEPDGASWYVPVLYMHHQDVTTFPLIQKAKRLPPNPFVSEEIGKDPAHFVGRKWQVQRLWDRLQSGSNLSIVGPAGTGKSTMLALIAAELRNRMGQKPRAIWLPLQRKMKCIEAELALARQLGGSQAKATDLLTLLEDQHIILLLDDLGQLEKGERGLDLRLWLRNISQNRLVATIQLVATSLRPLRDIFKGDESPDYSPLHNVMSDMIELGAFTHDEAKHFILKALEGTPFSLEDFNDCLKRSLVPRELQEHCRRRYDELCEQAL